MNVLALDGATSGKKGLDVGGNGLQGLSNIEQHWRYSKDSRLSLEGDLDVDTFRGNFH